jgi:hypothetical protein
MLPVIHNLLRTSPVFVLGFILSSTAWAGTIRDDKSDSLYTVAGSTYSAVGALRVDADSGTFGCSGSLIGDGSWVLTAGHCSDGATAGNATFSLGDTMTSFFLTSDTYAVDEVVPHPKWDGSLSKGYDIALMHLSSDAGTGASIYRGNSEAGSVGTIVGFGLTGTGLTGATNLDGKKRAGDNLIDGFFRTPGKTSRLFATDFTDPSGDSNVFGSEASENNEFLAVFGDSGGPVFIDSEIAGVNSFIVDNNRNGLFADYGDYGGATRVSAFADWIDSVLTGSGGGDGGDDDGGGGPPPGRGGGRFNAFGATSLLVSANQAVPEPSTFLLMALGLVAITSRKGGRTALIP